MVTKENKKPTNRQTWIFLAVVTVLAIILVFSGKKDDPNNQEPQTNEAGGNVLTQEEAEDYCQDANLIGTYFDLNKIDILANPFNADQPSAPYDSKNFGYDKDKNSIVHLIWTGWDRTTEEKLMFHCYISGKDKDSITLHHLSATDSSGTRADLYGDLNFTKYDKDGNEIE